VTSPIELPANQIRRFYAGGRRIAAFRGLPDATNDAPEDWVASTTSVHGDADLGRSRLADGTLLADVLAADPASFFDNAHREEFGREPGLLIKLLDAGERLPVHFHPDDAFAFEHLNTPCGKTEAWVILEAETDACVHVGFREPIDERELAQLVAAADAAALLGALSPLPVASGTCIFVPAGVPHAIGSGILLLELQQPSDLSLLLESGSSDPFLGLSRDVALQAIDRSAADLHRLQVTRGASLFPPEADRFFRAELVAAGDRLEASFAVLVVVRGDGELLTEMSEPLAISRGSTVLVPFGAGVTELIGSCQAVRCLPPVPVS
jgi:mannose-6-phosphate isomerase